jgi:hypothetical protein
MELEQASGRRYPDSTPLVGVYVPFFEDVIRPPQIEMSVVVVEINDLSNSLCPMNGSIKIVDIYRH